MQIHPIAGFLLLCGVMTFAIAVYAWRRRSTNGARQFSIFMASLSLYILGYGMELCSPDLRSMLLWNRIQYVGILTFPTLYLIFILQYTGLGRWLVPRNVLLLFVLPAILLAVKFMDGDLRLIYSSVAVETSGFIPMLSFERGPLYPAIAAFNLLVVTLANYFILRKRRFASALYRQQTAIMLAVGAIIYLVYLFYLSGITLLPGLQHLDLNPFVFTVWGSAIGVAIFRYRLFDLAPVARDALIEILSDGVIVLDAQGRVVDANPGSFSIFGWRAPPVGRPAGQALEGWLTMETLAAIDLSTKLEAVREVAGRMRDYEVTVTALTEKRGQKVGWLVVVHDISDRKENERKLQELSLVDDLTGLTNRRGFKLLAGQLVGMANRMKLNAVLLYIDLDGLKWINDHLGHATGDQALIEMASILKTTFRASDIVVRYGGDEFVILAIETAENTGAIMLARLEEQTRLQHRADSGYSLSFSVGTAHYDWQEPQTIEVLLGEADRAMYEDKQRKKEKAV